MQPSFLVYRHRQNRVRDGRSEYREWWGHLQLLGSQVNLLQKEWAISITA